MRKIITKFYRHLFPVKEEKIIIRSGKQSATFSSHELLNISTSKQSAKISVDKLFELISNDFDDAPITLKISPDTSKVDRRDLFDSQIVEKWNELPFHFCPCLSA